MLGAVRFLLALILAAVPLLAGCGDDRCPIAAVCVIPAADAATDAPVNAAARD